MRQVKINIKLLKKQIEYFIMMIKVIFSYQIQHTLFESDSLLNLLSKKIGFGVVEFILACFLLCYPNFMENFACKFWRFFSSFAHIL